MPCPPAHAKLTLTPIPNPAAVSTHAVSTQANAKQVLEQGISLQGLKDLLQQQPHLARISPNAWTPETRITLTAGRHCR